MSVDAPTSSATGPSRAPGGGWQVVRFDTWLDPAFDRTLAVRSDVVLHRERLAAPRETALAALAHAHVLHLSPARDEVPVAWHVTASLLAQCPELLLVSSGGAGYDTIDVDACTAAGVAVVNQAGGNAASVAEHTIGLLLAVTHRLAESDRLLRTRRGFAREHLMGREVRGKAIGLVGIGHVGTQVARIAAALGMRVLATDPNLTDDEIRARGAEPVDFLALLAAADVVSLHCPRLDSTIRMMDAAAFARMKPGSVFITTARGGIHDEAALHAALVGGHLAGAGLDVWETEPPPLDHPLLALDTVVATYHTAGVTHECRRNIAAIAADQILAVLDGERPPRLLNPEAWQHVQQRRAAATGR